MFLLINLQVSFEKAKVWSKLHGSDATVPAGYRTANLWTLGQIAVSSGYRLTERHPSKESKNVFSQALRLSNENP
jgi:hypothetical protein